MSEPTQSSFIAHALEWRSRRLVEAPFSWCSLGVFSAHLNVERFRLVWPNWSREAKIFLLLDTPYTSSLSISLHTLYRTFNDPITPRGNSDNFVQPTSFEPGVESLFYWCQRRVFGEYLKRWSTSWSFTCWVSDMSYTDWWQFELPFFRTRRRMFAVEWELVFFHPVVCLRWKSLSSFISWL